MRILRSEHRDLSLQHALTSCADVVRDRWLDRRTSTDSLLLHFFQQGSVLIGEREPVKLAGLIAERDICVVSYALPMTPIVL